MSGFCAMGIGKPVNGARTKTHHQSQAQAAFRWIWSLIKAIKITFMSLLKETLSNWFAVRLPAFAIIMEFSELGTSTACYMNINWTKVFLCSIPV